MHPKPLTRSDPTLRLTPVSNVLVALLLVLVVAQLYTSKGYIWSTDDFLEEEDDDAKSEAFSLIATLVDSLTTILGFARVHRNVSSTNFVAGALSSIDTSKN